MELTRYPCLGFCFSCAVVVVHSTIYLCLCAKGALLLDHHHIIPVVTFLTLNIQYHIVIIYL
jgi:hypothetical protein